MFTHVFPTSFHAFRLRQALTAFAGRLDARAVYSRQPQGLLEHLCAFAPGLRVLDVRQCGLESEPGRESSETPRKSMENR